MRRECGCCTISLIDGNSQGKSCDVDIDSYDYERWEGKVTFCDECDEKFKIGYVEVDYY